MSDDKKPAAVSQCTKVARLIFDKWQMQQGITLSQIEEILKENYGK